MCTNCQQQWGHTSTTSNRCSSSSLLSGCSKPPQGALRLQQQPGQPVIWVQVYWWALQPSPRLLLLLLLQAHGLCWQFLRHCHQPD